MNMVNRVNVAGGMRRPLNGMAPVSPAEGAGPPQCSPGSPRSPCFWKNMRIKQGPTTIVSLFVRGREIGFAVIESGALVRYGIKTIKGRRRGPAFAGRVEKALSPVLDAPNSRIVIERNSDASQQGALVKALPQIVKRLSKKGYALYSLPLREVKKRLCDTPKATHGQLSEVIAAQYPILWPLITGAEIRGAKYWEKVFIAVALAEVAMRQFLWYNVTSQIDTLTIMLNSTLPQPADLQPIAAFPALHLSRLFKAHPLPSLRISLAFLRICVPFPFPAVLLFS